MTRVSVSAPVISPTAKRAGPSVRTVMVWLLTLVLAAGWVAFLRPTIWGGPLTYVVIRGTSMRPTYEPGDLVLVRREAAYGPGDIVAYRVPDDDIDSDLILIHRIIGGSGEEGSPSSATTTRTRTSGIRRTQTSSAARYFTFPRSAWS